MKAFLCQDQWLWERFSLDSSFILRFETFLIPAKTHSTTIANYQQREFKLLSEVHLGTAGYLITQSTAKFLLEIIKSLPADKLDAIDELMFRHFLPLKIYQLSPALCVQEMQYNNEDSLLFSQIELERKLVRDSHRVKIKRTLLEKVMREIVRPFEKHRARKLEKEREKYVTKFL